MVGMVRNSDWFKINNPGLRNGTNSAGKTEVLNKVATLYRFHYYTVISQMSFKQ